MLAHGPEVGLLTFCNQDPDESLTDAGNARHGWMLGKLVQSVAAWLWTDFPEQAVALGICESENSVADEKETKEIK